MSIIFGTLVFQCTHQCTQRLKAMRRAGAAIKPLFDERRAGKWAVRLASGSERLVAPDGRLPRTLVAGARYSLGRTTEFTLRSGVGRRRAG